MSKAATTDVSAVNFADLLKQVPQKEVLSKMARTDADIATLKEAAVAAGFVEGREAGYKEGLESGHAQGLEEGKKQSYDDLREAQQAEVDALHSACEQVIATVNESLREWYESGEAALAELATIISARIVARELQLDSTSILAITKEAVAEVTHATRARVKVNPFDSHVLVEHREAVLAASQSLRDVEIVEDPTILGGCVIETEGGIVEATIDMKLNEVLVAIRKSRETRDHAPSQGELAPDSDLEPTALQIEREAA